MVAADMAAEFDIAQFAGSRGSAHWSELPSRQVGVWRVHLIGNGALIPVQE
jgi:hypothetical protein